MKTLRVAAVAEKVSVHEQTIWLWVREGRFPKPFKVGPGVTVWDEAEIDQWLQARKQEGHDESS